jgi:hypothetical protein
MSTKISKVKQDIDSVSISVPKEYITYKTSDGLYFNIKKDAEKHQLRCDRVDDFKKIFGNNLKIGSLELATTLVPSPSIVKDYFWVKTQNKTDIDNVINFCYKHYRFSKLALKEQFSTVKPAWLFIVISINENNRSLTRGSESLMWWSEKNLKKVVKVISDSFPDKVSITTPSSKKTKKKSYIDLGD